VNGVNVVGWIGSNGKKDSGTLEFTHIDGGSTGGTRLVEIQYICADGPRDAYISVNNGLAQKCSVPKSGQRWQDIRFDFRVELNGFKPGRNNTLTFSNPKGWAPDIHRIGIEQPLSMAAAQIASPRSATNPPEPVPTASRVPTTPASAAISSV